MRHISRIAYLAVGAIVLLSTVRANAGNITVVENGKPKATIVIWNAASPKDKLAAEELQTYVRKMSGAELPIMLDTDKVSGTLLLVGKSNMTDQMQLVIPSKVSNDRRDEGFVIISKGDRIVLAGNSNDPYHGTEYAVYEFLNRLGVRWYQPGEWGEYVPSRKTITFPEISISQKPDFALRTWWCHQPTDREEMEQRWKIRNKMNPDLSLGSVVDGSTIYVLTDADFKSHPEWFAMNPDGTRNRDMPNFTNPDSVKAVAGTIKDFFRKNPKASAYGFAPPDGMPRDYSPETLKFSRGFTVDGGRPSVAEDISITDEWINFVNNVTVAVRKEFPDVYIGTNGYANRNYPPQGVTVNDHMSIMFANIMTCCRHSYDHPGCWIKQREAEMLKQWCKLSKNVWMYTYIDQMMVSALTPIPEVHKLRRDMPLLKKWGVVGMLDESRPVLAECGIMSRYLRAQLEWNANANVDALLNDYYANWYAGAAKPMKAFYEAIENAFDTTPIHGHEDRILPEVYTPRLMNELAQHLAIGEKLADTDRAKQHVQADRLIYQHLQAYVAMTDAELTCRFADAAKQASRMLQLRKQMNALNPFLAPEGAMPYEYWGVTQRSAFYQSLADLTDGKKGSMVAILPETAAFKTDPRDDGVVGGWFSPDYSQAGWKPILTTRPFYMQGYQDKDCYPYLGNIWYRLTVDVPASAVGKKVMLYSTVLETEGWVWVNGQFIEHRPYAAAYIRPYPLDVDVSSALRPGKNTIAIRVNTSLGAAQEASGLLSRLFLYSPK
jgi:hypothetical protein